LAGRCQRRLADRIPGRAAAALWAYDGWEDLNLVGSEVKDPQKNFPRALVGGVGLVAIIYLTLQRRLPSRSSFF